ncbi:hypothetical protein RIVM261_085440 [Rivularia sp. IAM M-261]|nr:hypothetical protein RIVM261_085440 [Rivularia sp. IAM M-261]
MTNNQKPSSKIKIEKVGENNLDEAKKMAQNGDKDVKEMIHAYLDELNSKLKTWKKELDEYTKKNPAKTKEIDDKENKFKAVRSHRDKVDGICAEFDRDDLKKIIEKLQGNELKLRKSTQELKGMLDNKNVKLEDFAKHIPGVERIFKIASGFLGLK